MLCFEQVAPGIDRLKVPLGPIWTGVFLIRGPETYLIDSGSSRRDAEERILPALARAGVALADISLLLCTHCHGDHVGGHRALTEAGLRAACYEGSRDKLRDPLRYSRAIRAAFPEHSPQAPGDLRGCEPARLLADGERLGGYLRLIATPGHDTDTVCFLDERTGTLLTGDSLQWDGTVTQGTALVMALPAYLSSLKKLEGLRPQRIVAGHPYLPVGEEIVGEAACLAALRQCRESMTRYAIFLEDCWRRGIRETSALAAALIDHIGGARPEHLFLPMHTVRAHLDAFGHQVEKGGIV